MTAEGGRGEITRLLHAWRAGDDGARAELWETLYQELKQLARSALNRGGRNAGHDATSLVHKAYLRLLDSELEWVDRQHFFAVAARAMRFVLADEARRQLSSKRGSGAVLSLDDEANQMVDPLARPAEEVLAVHEALDRLAEQHQRYARLVELRYFAGLSVEESATILEITPRTVVRDWRAIKVWLHGEVSCA